VRATRYCTPTVAGDAKSYHKKNPAAFARHRAKETAQGELRHPCPYTTR
jgi:hypothetical protein